MKLNKKIDDKVFFTIIGIATTIFFLTLFLIASSLEIENFFNELKNKSNKEPIVQTISQPPISIEKVEARYKSNPSIINLHALINAYNGKKDYDKALYYYELLLPKLNKEEYASSNSEYIKTLYKVGRKDEYYKKIDQYINDKYAGLGNYKPETKKILNTLIITTVILDSENSNINDYNIAIEKLKPFENYKFDLETEYTVYFIYNFRMAQLYSKIGDKDKNSFYKNKVINNYKEATKDKFPDDTREEMIKNFENSLK